MTLAGSHLLVVDDNRDLADNVSEILQSQGAQVYVASSLSEARGLAVEHLDVGLVDVQLPDGLGTDLLRELKQHQPDAEVLLVTGHGSLEDAARAVGTGAFAYVLKPVQPTVLIANVEHALRQVRTSRDLREKEEALRVAQRTESVARLVDEVAHDFNNLLGVIRGYARSMRAGLDDPDVLLTHADAIHRCTVRGEALTKQLLNYSRRKSAEPAPLQPNEVIEQLSHLWERIVSARVRVHLDLAADAGLVHADVSQLEQVLMNLVINARDAMPEGGELTVSTSRTHLVNGTARALDLTPGPHVRLSVSDTGVGMDEATRARALQTFFTTKGDKGTGLGLSTVQSIVQEHGGGLEIDSALGRGTRIDVYLPQHLASEPGSDAHPAGVEVEGRPRVLLVEDEELLRMAARGYLEDFGYDVVEATTVSEALALAAQEWVDVLVTDLRLPDGQGPELAKQLLESHSDLRVLVMTGLDDPEQTGGLPVLRKPFDLEDLPRRVEQLGEDAQPAGPRPTILLVEDEGAARAALATLLEDDFDVTAVASGVEALEAVRRRNRSFDVLLADLQLPDMHGSDLAERVREMHPTAQVVFVSGLLEPELPPWAEFVSKPIDFDALEALLRASTRPSTA